MAFQDFKLLFITANLMGEKPTDPQIKALKDTVKLDKHDIVVVAEQETAEGAGGWIAQRLATLTPGWKFADPKGSAKNCRTDIGKSRRTEKSWFTGRQITIGTAWGPRVDSFDLHFSRDTVKGKRKAVVVWTGKGAVLVYMDIGAARLAFAGCHLNDKSDGDRNTESNAILKSIEQNDPNLIFIGGDLNFRPTYTGKPLDGSELIKQISNNPKTFHDECNDFKRSALVGSGFKFPAPDFFPTYKRRVEKGKISPISAKPSLKELEQFYDITELNKRKGEYGIGWLDRIGYREDNLAKVSDVNFDWLPNCLGGDHCPVFLSAKISVDTDKS